MIVLPRNAIKRLCEKGQLDVWSPRSSSEPAMQMIHVVRARSDGDTFTHAQAIRIRTCSLERLTYPDALNAGFKTRDDFLTWFHRRHAVKAPGARCWVVTYQRVVVDVPQFLARGGGYTTDRHQAVDVGEVELETGVQRMPLEAVTDPFYLRRWAKRAEQERLENPPSFLFPWEKRRKGRKAA